MKFSILFFKDLIDHIEREHLAAARATIKRTSLMLLTSSKVYLSHPKNSSAQENRDFVYKQLLDAINTISSVTQGQSVISKHDPSLNTTGDLMKLLNEFDVKYIYFFCIFNKSNFFSF